MSQRKTRATGSSKRTINHNVIRRWAEARCGRPATVKNTGNGSQAGVLRIDFPGYRGKQRLQEISWEEFFEKFDEKNLAFIYQDRTSTGRQSHFCKLVNRTPARTRPRR